MPNPDQRTMFRGGVAYRAADVAPTTARTWPIDIGVRSGEGHKRYDLVDVVSLSLMRWITTDVPVAASWAAAAVNRARPLLQQEIARQAADVAAGLRPRWDGGRYLVILPNGDGEAGPLVTIEDTQGLARLIVAERSQRHVQLIVPVQRLIATARAGLEQALKGD